VPEPDGDRAAADDYGPSPVAAALVLLREHDALDTWVDQWREAHRIGWALGRRLGQGHE